MPGTTSTPSVPLDPGFGPTLRTWLVGTTLLFLAAPTVTAEVPLVLGETMHDMRISASSADGWEIQTTGSDPYVLCRRTVPAVDTRRFPVLSFEYQCPKGLAFLEVFWGRPFGGLRHASSGPVPPSTTWRTFSFDLAAAAEKRWAGTFKYFRLDFGNQSDVTLQVRRVRLRARTAAEEKAAKARRTAAARRRRALQQAVDARRIAPALLDRDANGTLSAVYGFADGSGITTVAVLGRDLDLASELRRYAPRVPPAASLPPAMAVSEGAAAKNHTIVRLLNRYGICEIQFLAYPAGVRGGVDVQVGTDEAGRVFIVTAPLRSTTVREVRVFNRYGNLRCTFDVLGPLDPPFTIAAGDFLTGTPGDEFALASSTPTVPTPTEILIYTPSGRVVKRLTLGERDSTAGDARLHLATQPALPGASPPGARLIAYRAGTPKVAILTPDNGTRTRIPAGLPPDCTAVFPDPFAPERLVGCGAGSMFSKVYRTTETGRCTTIDVGRRENLFWFAGAGAYANIPEGRYTRHARFAHIRTDFGSPRAADPDFSRTDATYWAGPEWERRVQATLNRLAADPPVCYEPCFSHRWFYAMAQKWAAARDAETGLPKYVLLDRENNPGTYGEFGRTKSFVSGTYAPGLDAVRAMYVFPQRVFLRKLVGRLRSAPDNVVAVEPNHEMEINAESPDTHGDYNPAMIRAFCRHLLSLYGTLENINRRFRTPFTARAFDAPRNLDRGAWDAYSANNPFYRSWMRFLAHIIDRVVAGTYREALLAGVPPELIKCHQIPDLYAVGSLTAFSQPAQRITPIDWELTAGVGFGFTRYGVWFERRRNCVQGPHSSGFDNMVIGEYHSLTPNVELAFKQLAYLHGNGVQFIHCMNWPKTHDRGFNAALAKALHRLVRRDLPRPGVAGGVGQVRSFRDGDTPVEVVSIGVGPGRTGLLKSVKADGRWDGRVYVTPFHAHVDVSVLPTASAMTVGKTPVAFGPFETVDPADVFEFSGLAESATNADGALLFRVFHHGIELPGLRVRVPVTARSRHFRFMLRVQIGAEDLRIDMRAEGGDRVALRNFSALRFIERAVRLRRGIFEGVRHEGGVRFDFLPSTDLPDGP
ncbi:MAG: hypothetical protein GXP31_18880 [Kiritimatiellaeota bacterium]|nr:hypothetical protein [Kiritimatiellota bacterium]